MTLVEKLGKKYRGPWLKVKFLQNLSKEYSIYLRNVDFCEAIREAKSLGVLILSVQDLTAPGEKFVFGSGLDKDRIIKRCKEVWELPEDKISKLIEGIPHLPSRFRFIGLNMDGEPDILLSHLQPYQFMYLLRDYQKISGESLNLKISTVLGVCGDAVVRTFLKQEISISFGCKIFRERGGVPQDTFVVAVPLKWAKKLTEV